MDPAWSHPSDTYIEGEESGKCDARCYFGFYLTPRYGGYDYHWDDVYIIKYIYICNVCMYVCMYVCMLTSTCSVAGMVTCWAPTCQPRRWRLGCLQARVYSHAQRWRCPVSMKGFHGYLTNGIMDVGYGLYCYTVLYIYIYRLCWVGYIWCLFLKFGFADENDLSYYVNVGYVYMYIWEYVLMRWWG